MNWQHRQKLYCHHRSIPGEINMSKTKQALVEYEEDMERNSLLTWDNVVKLLRGSSPTAWTNAEIAKKFDVIYNRASFLTIVMYDAGAIDRLKVGMSHLYFIGKEGFGRD